MARARVVAKALFDVPATLADHRGRQFGEVDALNTLVRIRSSGLVPENIIREADANRNRRSSAGALGQPAGQGNAALGGGPDPKDKALKRASTLAKVDRLSAAVKCLKSFLDERDNPLPPPEIVSVLQKLRELHPDSSIDDELPAAGTLCKKIIC